jgi:hypothetical protein
MPDIATILAALFPHPVLHHPVMVLHPNGFQGLVAVIPWGA